MLLMCPVKCPIIYIIDMFLDKDALGTMVLSYLSYCVIAWGLSLSIVAILLQRLQQMRSEVVL